ncbi:hypothetical protein JCM5353_006009 [Sporobolomyces roseus]
MAAPSSSEPTIDSLASSLTLEILHELIADVAVEEHQLAQLRRSRIAQQQASASYTAQNGLLAVPNGVNGTSTSPTKKDKDDGLFACMVCNRQVAAPRYASHLSGCMGLSGSRRGERRAAANAAAVSNGKANGARNGSGTSNYGSDTDTEKKNGINGIKRSATSSPAGQNKKSKPTPLSSTPSTSANFQPPHIGSHPLSKTMSLPASPINSPTATSHSIPPRPSSVAPGAQPPHQSSSSQPLQRLPSKTPSVQNGRPHPLAQTQTNAPSQPTNYPAKAPVRPPAPKPPVAKVQNDDRPDSDSEDSDSDLEVTPSVPTTSTTTKPPLPPQAQASKTPRVPPPASKSKVGVKNNGVSEGMQRNGSSQKQPRKQMPGSAGGGGNGAGNGAGAVGRKAARPIAGVNPNDSASSDEEGSDGSGSD